MFEFFIALAIQALLEREVRKKMKEQNIDKVRVYPEQREASHPTTSKILDRFSNICTYKIMENSKVVETFKITCENFKKVLNQIASDMQEKRDDEKIKIHQQAIEHLETAKKESYGVIIQLDFVSN